MPQSKHDVSLRAPSQLPRSASVVIFDGDDTLWKMQHIYDRAKIAFLNALTCEGFNRRSLRETFEQIDYENVRKLGFSTSRFPRSMVETYRIFCRIHSKYVDRDIEKKLRSIGQMPFQVFPGWTRGARSTLKELSRSFRLVLYTAGDAKMQKAKIDHLDLRRYFESIAIVRMKDPESLRQLLKSIRAQPGQVILVGNSLRSDIAPALAVGIKPVLFESRSWRYDQSVALGKKVHVIKSLTELTILAKKLLRY